MDELEQKLLAFFEAQQAKDAKAAEAGYATKADVEAGVTAAMESLTGKLGEMIEAQVQKALPALRESGAGRTGESAPKSDEERRDENPAEYIISKAKAGHDGMSAEDKVFIAEITKKALLEGVKA